MFDFFGTGLVWDGGAILFPLSYILGDVITELYGFKKAKKVIFITMLMTLLAALTLFGVQLLPPGPGWENQTAYEAVLGFFPRIVLGSVIAYLVGQVLNSYVFSKIKVATKGKRLWVRALGSSLVGNLVDTLIFITIAFVGTISSGQFIGLLALAYASKMVGETVLLPVTYTVIRWLKKLTGQDHYDKKLGLKDVFRV